MRKLNEDQSVLFFAPPEIDRDIRRVVKKDPDEIIDSRDVLEWSLEQTMEYLRRNQPLWVVQGLNHRYYSTFHFPAFHTRRNQQNCHSGFFQQLD